MKSPVIEKDAASPGRALDVIVADDEPSDNLLLALAAQDAEVEMNFTFAEDGEELLQILIDRVASGQAPDVVVLDIRMPRCNGLEALEAISLSASLRRIPVVMFTTSRRAADMERGLSLGAARFEIKPSTYPELVAFANDLVDIARG
ncbi:MAG TPA: response regulator [Acidimicrobiales bacterium]|nr:response regulator [Acidimicrobiales bacterium]